eukprot:scaffold156506_cov13-Tisochrysis_lutea.AAC.1
MPVRMHTSPLPNTMTSSGLGGFEPFPPFPSPGQQPQQPFPQNALHMQQQLQAQLLGAFGGGPG